jgi:hypothetical protein
VEELLKRPVEGALGCVMEATPATILDQFESAYCAYLFYDFVLLDQLNNCISLHTDGPHPKRILLDNFVALRERGIAFDPDDIFFVPSEELSDKEFKSRYLLSADSAPEHRHLINAAIKNAEHCYIKDRNLREHIASIQGVSSKGSFSIPNEFHSAFQESVDNLNMAYREVRGVSYKIAAINSGYSIDSGILIERNYDRNDEIRKMLGEGHIPIFGGSAEKRPIASGEEMRTFQLVLKNIPLPRQMPVDEFVDFRNRKNIRKSIGSFRKLAGDLVSGQAPASYIVEELMDKYEEYKSEAKKISTMTRIGNVKFIASNISGFIEDIIKLRIESFAKRPFEIAEYFVDKRYSNKEFEDSPFFFMYELDSSTYRLD